MKRNVNVFIPLGLGAFLLLILFFPGFCAAGDKAPELPVPILSLPGNLADLPMEIFLTANGYKKKGCRLNGLHNTRFPEAKVLC